MSSLPSLPGWKTLIVCGMLAACPPSVLAANPKPFLFGVLPFPAQVDANAWKAQLEAGNNENLAFMVINGLKAKIEPCSDQLYQARKAILDESEHGVIFSLSQHDWSECNKADGSNNGIERLSRLRELLFADEFSLGNSKLELTRLAISPKFRNYPENARWEINGVLFATINLPSNNNRFRAEAGRNNEYEDRQVANREWLQRLFAQAKNKNLQAIVLFADGSLMGNGYAKTGKLRTSSSGRNRDGFADLQQKFLKLTEHYNGKVLLIDHQPVAGTVTGTSAGKAAIQWRGKIGQLNLPATDAAQRYTVLVQPNRSTPFSVKN